MNTQEHTDEGIQDDGTSGRVRRRPRPERIVEAAIRAAVGSPEYVARIACEDLRAAGWLR